MKFFNLLWFLVPLLTMSFSEAIDDAPPPAPAPPARPAAAPDPSAAGIEALIARHNSDLRSVIDKLYSENYRYREQIRDYKEEVTGLKAQAPKDNQVVQSKEDAALLEQYKQLGEIDTIKALQGELGQKAEQLGALQRDLVLRDVADVAGVKLPVLKTLGAELEYEIKEVEQDGKQSKVVFVKEGDTEAKPLLDYAKDNWQDFLPALQTEPPQQQPQQGTRFPQQSTGDKPTKVNVVNEFMDKTQKARDEKPNPLVKQAA